MTPDGPAIVWANWYRFRSGQRLAHPRVLSRCILWVVQGSGTVVTDGRALRLEQHALVQLPWAHDIEYRADARTPFRLGTVHLVPRHAKDVAVDPRVELLLGDPADAPGRAGAGVDERVAEVASSASGAGRRIAELGAVGIERFHAEPYDERAFRLLAELIVHESEGLASDAVGVTARAPIRFQQMTEFIVENLRRPLSVAEVADVGGCSAATAERLFARHASTSVQAWIRQTRMREAARMLRTSGLGVGEVAALVGFSDPLYFSRVFRAEHGVPPSRYPVGGTLP